MNPIPKRMKTVEEIHETMEEITLKQQEKGTQNIQ